MLSATSKKAIEFYGGVERWKNAKTIKANVSVSGLAFTLKRRPFFQNATIEMDVHQPFSKLTPIGKDQSISGVLAENIVELRDENGVLLSERTNPRSYFPFGRRLFYWDDLDMSYFANYAFWNYFTLPALLMNEKIKWTEKNEGILIAEFPESIPTHNKLQEFHFEKESGKLMQHNYTAEIISKLATVAHVIHKHNDFNGLTIPSHRIATPKGRSGKALKKPILIEINVNDFELI